MAPDVRPGAQVSRFRVEPLLGAGRDGRRLPRRGRRPERRVALKLLRPSWRGTSASGRRFLRETELAASLDHPHVVPTLAAGEEDGALYLAMAYVDGSDLRKLLRREGRLEPERAVELVAQVAGALDAAHAAGLVHRDVKPGNILVAARDGAERAYVCDFGLARHVSSVSSLTGDRGFVGTIDYVPPEQIEGGTIDGRADVYSLGCVLFECLAGARPFDRESELSVVFAHLNDPPPRLTELRPDLPAAFDAVFETALAKSPDDRYSTCGELAAAARAALQGKVFARRRPRRRRVALAAARRRRWRGGRRRSASEARARAAASTARAAPPFAPARAPQPDRREDRRVVDRCARRSDPLRRSTGRLAFTRAFGLGAARREAAPRPRRPRDKVSGAVTCPGRRVGARAGAGRSGSRRTAGRSVAGRRADRARSPAASRSAARERGRDRLR